MKNREWQKKINRSRQTKRQILRWIRRRYDKNAKLVDTVKSKIDIKSDVFGDIRIKEDRVAHQTNFYAINDEDKNGSSFFVLVDWEKVIMLPTEALNFLINSCEDVKTVPMGYKLKNGKRTMGSLIPREYLLSSPYTDVLTRWFPIKDD